LAAKAILALASGDVFTGHSIGALGRSTGEVVFNTAMTGYQEILTDPSYARQMVTLTHPHIGNTGCNAEDFESDVVHAAGLIVRDLPLVASSWRKEENLSEFLKRHGTVAISNIDTRALTRILRSKGSQNACLVAADEISDADLAAALQAATAFPGLKNMDLASSVSTQSADEWTQPSWDGLTKGTVKNDEPFHVVAFDFGVKRNILRMLVDRGCRLTVVPATTTAAAAMALAPDGIFLSNGPGDPEPCGYAIDTIKTFLEANIPMFGICLGHQLLGLAAGAKTQKMGHGHHGANHPVQDLKTGVVMITSQNHGFCLDESQLSDQVEVTHRSLFDGTIQGVRHKTAPAFGFQGHPEASPGPHDVAPLFDQFIKSMTKRVG
jgi:carbamoyl-phosphate synthase small subunit